ncbi:hypothetical protein Ddc_24864 [Ditylenchus destructor]|nr:hypothetical protein Ddc_24864 [Ditylenchus destructor]
MTALGVGGSDGVISALSAKDGTTLWRAEIGKGLSAGVGSDGRFAAAVTGGERAGRHRGRQDPVAQGADDPGRDGAPFVAGERVSCSRWTAPCWPSTPPTAAACGSCAVRASRSRCSRPVSSAPTKHAAGGAGRPPGRHRPENPAC